MIITDNSIESIINELSKIDSATEKVISTGQNEKNEYNDSIIKKTKEFDKSIEDASAKELDDFENSLRSDAEKKLENVTSEVELEKEKLNKAFDNNKSVWAKSIFEQIIQ